MGTHAAGAARARVFISYSGYEGVVQQVVDALVKALTRDGFEPEWDRARIGLGNDVKAEVEAMIERCDAAVVVVGKRALEHENRWVFGESILLTRRNVTVIPVYVEDQAPTTLPASWSFTGLPDIASYVVVGKSRRAMTRTVIKALAGARALVLASDFERELRDYLTGADVDTLKRAAQPIAGEPPRWTPGDLSLQVAFQLLKESLTTAWSTYENFARVLELSTAQMCARVGLPFTWVDRVVAVRIGGALVQGRPVALNITDQPAKLCEAYVHCGWPRCPSWTVYAVGEGWDGTTAALAAEIERRLQDHATAYFIRRQSGRSLDVVLAVPCPGFSADVIGAARAAVADDHGVSLVFLGGDADWLGVAPQLRDEIAYERIDVDDQHEEGAYLWKNANAALCMHRHKFLGDPSVCA